MSSIITRQNLLVAAVSGTISVTGYILLKRLLSRSLLPSPAAQEASKIYEDKALLDQYMMFNFSSDKEMLLFDNLAEHKDVTNCFLFPKRVALLCREHCPEIFFTDSASSHPRSALDVGCAVGRSCFELSKLFDTVVGIDYSVNFIDHCNKVLKERVVDYECTLEGNVTQRLVARLDSDVVRFQKTKTFYGKRTFLCGVFLSEC